jgi:hypothetical protein
MHTHTHPPLSGQELAGEENGIAPRGFLFLFLFLFSAGKSWLAKKLVSLHEDKFGRVIR